MALIETDEGEEQLPLGAVPVQRRSIDRRERLYRAALAEYAEHGVHGAKIERVVEQLGYGWGTFFHYFPRKADVLLTAGIEVQDRMEAAVAATHPDQPLRDRLWAAYAAFAEPIYGLRVHLAVIREVLGSPVRFERLLGGRPPFWMTLAALLEEGQASTEVRDDISAEALARLLNLTMLAAASRIGVPGRVGLPEQDVYQAFETTFTVLWDGMTSGGRS